MKLLPVGYELEARNLQMPSSCGSTFAGMDVEELFGAAKRPLIIGIGGGGDVVGALATAEMTITRKG